MFRLDISGSRYMLISDKGYFYITTIDSVQNQDKSGKSIPRQIKYIVKFKSDK